MIGVRAKHFAGVPAEFPQTSPMRPWQLGLIAARAAWANRPRCGAGARSAGGRPCRQPIVAGRTRCHYRGGSNPGPIGHKNGLRTGLHTAEAKQARREASAARRAARQQIKRALRRAARLDRKLRKSDPQGSASD